jgi:hypothetical protein
VVNRTIEEDISPLVVDRTTEVDINPLVAVRTIEEDISPLVVDRIVEEELLDNPLVVAVDNHHNLEEVANQIAEKDIRPLEVLLVE